MDSKNVQELLEIIEREIKDLKVASAIAPTVKTYWLTYTPTSTNPIIITFKDGKQPILAVAYGFYSSIMGNINDNTQKLLHYSATPLELVITSTRPILSISQ